MTISPEALVNREIQVCLSYLVATVAKGYGADIRTGFAPSDRDISDLAEQAFELACPIEDWEESALQSLEEFTDEFGVKCWRDNIDGTTMAGTAQQACEHFSLEPYQREVFEHWAVSDWLADKLDAHGEKVDRDFAGLCVWARTTTGQAIYADGVIEAICAELNNAQ